MTETLAEIGRLLGLGRDVADVNVTQMALRTVAVYAFALLIIRLGSKRFLSKASAFDMVVAVMFGSIMSRGINGSAPFLPTLASGAVLVGAHWLLAALAYRLDWFGPVVKGSPITLVRDGIVDQDAMQRTGVSARDLEQALRAQGKVADSSRVRLAVLERDGSISVLSRHASPQVVEVSVQQGVQTVRVELG